jgi:hypothetical protein
MVKRLCDVCEEGWNMGQFRLDLICHGKEVDFHGCCAVGFMRYLAKELGHNNFMNHLRKFREENKK